MVVVMDKARRVAVLWTLRMVHDAVMRLRCGVLDGHQERELQKIQYALGDLIDREESVRS